MAAMNPMDVVKQTGKTIIFEEFFKDLNVMDLVTLLTKDEQEIPIEKFKEALMGKESQLVVENFEQFVEKFSPTIYETVVKVGDTSRFVYELEKPKYDCTEIKLKDHSFYKMILALLDRKATSDKGNLEFPYDDLKKALSPQSEMENCKQIRKNLLFNMKEYTRLTESEEPNAVEAQRIAQNIVAFREKIVEKYQNKSPLSLIPLMIADKQSQIEQLKKAEDSNDSNEASQALPCYYSFDEQGELRLIEQAISDDAPDQVKQDDYPQLLEVLRDDFKEYAPIAYRDNSYVTDMVVNVFVPSSGEQKTTQDRDKLENDKKQLQDIYRSSLESFAKAVATVVEKFAGVKSFFDHATYDRTLPRDVSVIIANCKIDKILDNDLAKKRFTKYFSALSAEKDINKIWFGIIPAVAYESKITTSAKTTSDPFGRLKTDSTASKKRTSDLVGLETVKEMLNLLNEVKIMTFVNFKASEKTGFVALNKTEVDKYKKNFESINSEYAVFTYPNFTILPREKSEAKIGTVYDKDVTVEVPGVYLDASYVACGMLVGVQNYSYLKSKGYKVTPKYPCVRFDLEDPNNNKRVTTKLNRETTTEMLKGTQDAIMEDRFGFVFADNKIVFDGKALINSYVINARSLNKDNNGKYKPLYKTLVKNLVDQLLRSSDDIVTSKSVEQFKIDYVDTWKRDNKDEERKYANRILLEGETIDLDPGKHRLVVKFNKDEEVWDDIVINDEGSEE